MKAQSLSRMSSASRTAIHSIRSSRKAATWKRLCSRARCAGTWKTGSCCMATKWRRLCSCHVRYGARVKEKLEVIKTRKQLAKLSFTEKVKLLEKLRDRSLAIAASRKPKKESK